MAQVDLTAAVKSFMNGDQAAFQDIYDGSCRYIYYTILKSVQDKDLADDIMQETYIEIFKNLSSLKEPEAFKGWAAVIAQNKISRYFRKKSDSVFSSEEEMDTVMENVQEEDTDMLPSDAADNKEVQRLIMDIIDELPDGQKEAIISFYYNQMSISEIAEALEIPENTVKTWLSRGKKRIKEGVLELEKKHGIKLYTLPFMAALSLLFTKEAEACELPEGTFGAVSSKLAADTSAHGAASAGAAKTAAVKAAGASSNIHWGIAAAIPVTIGAAGVGAVVGLNASKKDAVVQEAEVSTETATEISTESIVSSVAAEETEAAPSAEEVSEAETEEASTEEASTEAASTEPEEGWEIPDLIKNIANRTRTYTVPGIESSTMQMDDGSVIEIPGREAEEVTEEATYVGEYRLAFIASDSTVEDKGDYYEVSSTHFVFYDDDTPQEDEEIPYKEYYDPITIRVRKSASMQTAVGNTTAEEYFKNNGNLGGSAYGKSLRTAVNASNFDSEGYLVKLDDGEFE